MDDELSYILSQCTPVGPPPVISDAQRLRDRLLRSGNTELASAEAQCYAGDVGAATATITRLLQTGTDLSDLQYCVLAAILSESHDLVRMLLGAGVSALLVNAKSAVTTKSIPTLSLFLQHGWNINEPEAWCIPPLLSCVAQSAYVAIVINPAHSHALATDPDESLIRWFLSNGADPNAKCEMDITPLSTAVGCAPLPIVKQLFAHCPVNTSLRGQLLHCAARRTSDDAEDVVRLVLERCRPNPNKILYDDDVFSYELRKVVGLGTALHEAARCGTSSVVQMLIREGTDVFIRDSRGNTALEVAEIYHNHAAAALLRSAEKSCLAKM